MARKAKLRIQILLRSRAATAAFSWLTFSKQLKLIQFIASKFIETEESFQEMAGLLAKRPYFPEGAIPADVSLVELGEIVSGAHPGRQSRDEITLFKSVGNAAQDLAVARLALDADPTGEL